MNISHKFLTITIIGILLLAGLLPSIQSIQSDAIEEEHPESYEVTRYNMRGLTYDKETITVSYEDAMAIKDAFEGIDSSFGDDKIERKREVLQSYYLIKEDVNENANSLFKSKNKVINFKISNRIDDFGDFFAMFSFIRGFFGPSVGNIISFLFAAPFFVCIAMGINAKIIPFVVGPELHYVNDALLSINLFPFAGVLLVIPFVSPGGYMDGFFGLGSIYEI